VLRNNTRNRAKFHRCRPNGVREKHYQKFVTPKSTKYPNHTTVYGGNCHEVHGVALESRNYIGEKIAENKECF